MFKVAKTLQYTIIVDFIYVENFLFIIEFIMLGFIIYTLISVEQEQKRKINFVRPIYRESRLLEVSICNLYKTIKNERKVYWMLTLNSINYATIHIINYVNRQYWFIESRQTKLLLK